MRKQEQGISVIGFLVVCAVLATLLVGSIFAFRKLTLNGGNVVTQATASSQQQSTSNTTKSSAKNDTANIPNSSASSDSGNSGKSSSGPVASTSTQSSSQANTSYSNTGTGTNGSSTSTNTSNTSVPQSTGQQGTTNGSDLPHTGPDDAIGQILGIGFVTAATIAYISSHKKRFSL